MTPHSKRQWCFSSETGTHWYAAPVLEFAPVYQFIRKNADCFDGFEAEDAAGLAAPKGVLAAVRRSAESGRPVVHVVNTDYDESAKKMRIHRDLRVTMPATLVNGRAKKAILLSWDAGAQIAPIQVEGDSAIVTLPELRLWTIVALAP